MKKLILYIVLFLYSIQFCFAENFKDAINEVNTCLNLYVSHPKEETILENITLRLETVSNRIKLTLNGGRDIFNQPYEIIEPNDIQAFRGLNSTVSLFIEYFQSIPYKSNLNIFTLEELNEVNSILKGMLTIEKINLKADNLEFWEVSIGDAKTCYIRNLSKSKPYTFIVKTRASSFEGGVMPNSLRVVSHNLGQAPYLRPLTVSITSGG